MIERQDPFPQLQKPDDRFDILARITLSKVDRSTSFEQALLLQLVTQERMPYYRTIGEMKQAREEFRQSN